MGLQSCFPHIIAFYGRRNSERLALGLQALGRAMSSPAVDKLRLAALAIPENTEPAVALRALSANSMLRPFSSSNLLRPIRKVCWWQGTQIRIVDGLPRSPVSTDLKGFAPRPIT